MSDLLHALRQHANQKPSETVVIGSRLRLSWRALNDEVFSLSDRLKGRHTIGFFMANSPAWIVTDLAILDAGIRAVPLPTFFSDDQLLHAISDANIDTIISDDPSRFNGLLNINQHETFEIAGKTCHLQYIEQHQTLPPVLLPSKVTYTSGTTGTPRGVQISTDTIETVASSLCEASVASSDDRALVLLPLSTLLENIGSVYAPILVCAQIIVPNPEDVGLSGSSQIDVQKLASAFQQFRPTTVILPPQLLKLVIGLARQQVLPGSFRYIAVGGAPVGQRLLDEAEALGLPVFQGYGLSEACSVVAVNTPSNNRPGSVGKPLPHATVRVSEQGEILVKGKTFEGYVNDSQRNDTDEVATGDLGYLDEDGYLYITGRQRNVIITSYGRNISPEWVESELLSHPSIAQAAIMGNNHEYLVAVVVPAKNGPQSEIMKTLDETIAEANLKLPDYAQIHDYVIADSPFCYGQGELTSNGRPRRDVIERHYSDRIEKLYEIGHEQIL
jgi:long-subunit acyl-CoA synthetase (AMP-forming)